MIAQELEVSLHMAFMDARQKRHELITVEHLLLAMIDNPTAAEVLRACGAKFEVLRTELNHYIEEHTPTMRLAKPSAMAVLPTPASPTNSGLFLRRRHKV